MPPEKNLISGAGSILAKGGSAREFEVLDLSDLMKEYQLSNREAVSLEANDPASRYAYLRNEMQDRIIASSNQRCGNYLREIIAAKSQAQMGWGTLSLLLSGAASVTTPIKTAQALAAGGAFAGGANTLYSESYFNSLAVGVIASGITKNREIIHERIEKRRKESLLNYPINMAVADAIAYHSSCNIIVGLETASNALKQTPGSPQTQQTNAAGTEPSAQAIGGDPPKQAASSKLTTQAKSAVPAIPAAAAIGAAPAIFPALATGTAPAVATVTEKPAQPQSSP